MLERKKENYVSRTGLHRSGILFSRRREEVYAAFNLDTPEWRDAGVAELSVPRPACGERSSPRSAQGFPANSMLIHKRIEISLSASHRKIAGGPNTLSIRFATRDAR